MIVQVYLDTTPVMWDNANQVEYKRMTRDDYEKMTYDSGRVYDYTHKDNIDPDEMIKYVSWVSSKGIHSYYEVYTYDDVYILNDEGKTLVSV